MLSLELATANVEFSFLCFFLSCLFVCLFFVLSIHNFNTVSCKDLRVADNVSKYLFLLRRYCITSKTSMPNAAEPAECISLPQSSASARRSEAIAGHVFRICKTFLMIWVHVTGLDSDIAIFFSVSMSGLSPFSWQFTSKVHYVTHKDVGSNSGNATDTRTTQGGKRR